MRFPKSAYWPLLAAGLALPGCAHSDAAPSASTSTSTEAQAPALDDDEATYSLAEHHRHHQGGLTAFIALSLDTLGADDPAKKAPLEKIQSDLKARLGPTRDAEQVLTLALADGIAIGTIDTNRVDAAVAELVNTVSLVHVAAADSLNELHALLSPAERSALVDKIQAHWAVWRQVNFEAEAGGREPYGHLANLAEELPLTVDQVDKISTSLKTAMAGVNTKFDPSEIETHIAAFSTAFASDSFDAHAFQAGSGASSHLAGQGARRMVLFYETVTPFLTTEQRTTLAANLHEHLTHQQYTGN